MRVTVCAIVCLCFCWLSCGSRVEKQLFSRDVSSGELWFWAVASHTGTKDPSPRGQTGHPLPGLASEQLLNRKTLSRNSGLATPSGASFSWFSPLLHLVLFFFLFLVCFFFFSQATSYALFMGNVLLVLVPWWLMSYHRYGKGRKANSKFASEWQLKMLHRILGWCVCVCVFVWMCFF